MFKHGDKVYYVTNNDELDYEVEGWIVDCINPEEKVYSILKRNGISDGVYSTAYINESRIVKIEPDYWEELDDVLKNKENDELFTK